MRGGWYDTTTKFKINEGAGKEFVAIGDTMAKIGKQQEDKKQQELANNYNKTMLKINEDKNSRDATKTNLDIKKEQMLIDDAVQNKDKVTALEDGMINAYESKHPIFMGKQTKDGAAVPGYSNLTREDKLALIKIAGMEQNNKNSPKITNVSTAEDGSKIAIFSDGTIKDLGFKAKTDWNTPKQKEVPLEDQIKIGEALTKQRILDKEKKSKLANFELE